MAGDIDYSDEVRTMLFVLLGDKPLRADSDLAYGSSVPFEDFATSLMTLRDMITDSLSSVRGALPPQVAQQYTAAMSALLGTGGVDHLQEFTDQLMPDEARHHAAAYPVSWRIGWETRSNLGPTGCRPVPALRTATKLASPSPDTTVGRSTR